MNREATGEQTAAENKRLRRSMIGLALFIVAIFLLLATGSYHPGDPPLADHPANREIRNICGPVGAYIAAGLHFVLGGACYPLVLLIAAVGAFIFVGRRLREPKTKLTAALVFVVTWACVSDYLVKSTPNSAVGPGGILGRVLNSYIFDNLGWGAWLALGALFIGSILFMSEFAPAILLRILITNLWERRGQRQAEQRGLVDAGPEPHPTPMSPSSVQLTPPIDPTSPPTATQEAPAPATTPSDLDLTPAAPLVPAPAPEPSAPETPAPEKPEPPPAEPEEIPSAEMPEPTVTPPPVDIDMAETIIEPPPEDAEEPESVAEPAPKRSKKGKSPKPKAAEGKDERAEASPHLLGPKPPEQEVIGIGPDFEIPDVELLDPAESSDGGIDDEKIRKTTVLLEKTLEEFNVDAQVVEVDRGPVITLYEIDMAPGIKIGKIAGLADDIARALRAQSIRIVAPIPGKGTVGIEVPNPKREMVRLRELFESRVLDRKRLAIPMLIGKDSSGQPLVADLAQMPHCLIAGATGSGKSVCINSLILSLLLTQRPDQLKLLLVDPKMVEFSAFQSLPHLMAPVLTDMKKATSVLEWATVKMDERYSILARAGARNITTFNNLGEDKIRERLEVDDDAVVDDFPFFLPYIIIIIDELADLMMVSGKEVENSIIRLAQKSRAVGIHLIIATQRPSVDVITGLIKSNLPSRIALQVAQKVDSRTILDRNGAEKLLGKGDMLFLPPGSSKLIRAQGTFVSDEEIRRVVNALEEQAQPIFDHELVRQRSAPDKQPWERDELYVEAVRIVAESQRGSVSLLQRRLTIGYSRAARLVDMMAEMGLVGEYKGSQAREVYITPEEWEDQIAREQQD